MIHCLALANSTNFNQVPATPLISPTSLPCHPQISSKPPLSNNSPRAVRVPRPICPSCTDATADRPTRDKAVASLKTYLTASRTFTKTDLLKLWKGLFYCISPSIPSTLSHLLSSPLCLSFDLIISRFLAQRPPTTTTSPRQRPR